MYSYKIQGTMCLLFIFLCSLSFTGAGVGGWGWGGGQQTISQVPKVSSLEFLQHIQRSCLIFVYEAYGLW